MAFKITCVICMTLIILTLITTRNGGNKRG